MPATDHHDVAILVMLLDHAITLLRADGDDRLADWLARDVAWIRADDGYGVDHLLNAIGGMGSPTDVIHSDVRIDRLLSDVFRLARKLQREERRRT